MESWIPLKDVNEMAQQYYDVLIIGTGAGGSSVLWRLCEKHGNLLNKIGVIEAGDILFQSHALNLSTMNWSRLESFFNEHSIKIGEELRY
jgi:glycine/D-amino acid oxidase-like deaminating enzyme